MRRLIILISTLALVGSVKTVAQDNYTPMRNTDAFKQKLSNMSAKVQTIESNFVQEKVLSVLSNSIVSRGAFCFKKENNIRWEYTEPYRYLIVLRDNQIFIKEESGQSQYDMQSNKMFQEMNRFISGCIQGEILKDEADYQIEYLENEKEYFVKLVPNAAVLREMLNEIQIAFNKDDLTVDRITMVESGGDYTKIEFVNKKLNVDIPLEKFSFN